MRKVGDEVTEGQEHLCITPALPSVVPRHGRRGHACIHMCHQWHDHDHPMPHAVIVLYIAMCAYGVASKCLYTTFKCASPQRSITVPVATLPAVAMISVGFRCTVAAAALNSFRDTTTVEDAA